MKTTLWLVESFNAEYNPSSSLDTRQKLIFNYFFGNVDVFGGKKGENSTKMTQEKKKPFLRLIHFQISLEVNLDLLSMFKLYSFLQDS